MFHPTHETMLKPGLRQMGDHWRIVCTFLDVRLPTSEEAVAWADQHMGDEARAYFRAGAVLVPNLIQPT